VKNYKIFRFMVMWQVLYLSVYAVLFIFFEDLVNNSAYHWVVTLHLVTYPRIGLMFGISAILLLVWLVAEYKTPLVFGLSICSATSGLFVMSMVMTFFYSDRAVAAAFFQWTHMIVFNVLCLLIAVPSLGADRRLFDTIKQLEKEDKSDEAPIARCVSPLTEGEVEPKIVRY